MSSISLSTTAASIGLEVPELHMRLVSSVDLLKQADSDFQAYGNCLNSVHRLQKHLHKDSALLRGYKTDIVYSRQSTHGYHALLKLTSTLGGSYIFDLVNLQMKKLLIEPLLQDNGLLTNRSPVGFINGLASQEKDFLASGAENLTATAESPEHS